MNNNDFENRDREGLTDNSINGADLSNNADAENVAGDAEVKATNPETSTSCSEPTPKVEAPRERETYSRTYTPGENGYTQQTFRSEPSGQNNYSPYGGGSGNVGGAGGRPYYQQKKKSKLPVILACAALVLVFAFTCMSIGFMIAEKANSDSDDMYSVYLKPEDTASSDASNVTESSDGQTEKTPSDTTTDDDTKAPGSSTATIQKNEGNQSAETTDYKVGDVMTKSEVAKLVKDSVVEITTEKLVTGSYFNQYVESGAGSGVIIASEGYIVTNNHVIKDASSVKIRLTNGNEYTAELIGTDASTDIALLKIEPTEKLTVATLGSSSNLSVAEDVLVIGNPLGELGGSVTSGIISALARDITVDGESMSLIQTNAAVNPGNSGGGMFNLSGELVGIVNAKSVGTDIEGLGFAIPIDTAYEVVLQLMDYGYVKGRIDHGLELIDITDIFTAASYHVSAYGVYVYESKYSDDIKNGDRITSMNGTEITTSSDVKTALKDCNVGDSVDVTVARNGKLVNVKLTLHEYVPESTGNVSFG